MKLTKTVLNKFIIWTTSKYNSYRKSQVVNIILNGFFNNETGKRYFESGSYCPCSSMSGGYDYIVDFDNKEIIKCYLDNYNNIKKEF